MSTYLLHFNMESDRELTDDELNAIGALMAATADDCLPSTSGGTTLVDAEEL